MEELNLEIASEFFNNGIYVIIFKVKKHFCQMMLRMKKELTEEELLRRIIEYKKYKRNY